MCGAEVDVTVDELLEDEEFFCDDCAYAAILYSELFYARDN